MVLYYQIREREKPIKTAIVTTCQPVCHMTWPSEESTHT
jgi:hypothetical protein